MRHNFIYSAIERCGLVWLADWGIGYLPIDHSGQKMQYFDEYSQFAETEMDTSITNFRKSLVDRHGCSCHERVLDVGIGCGQFLKAVDRSVGYDVDPKSIEWLKNNNRFFDIEADDVSSIGCLTFWDSIEHIEDPSPFLDTNRFRVFISTPIYRDLDHVKSSKHYKPNEHVWYFTELGLIRYMDEYGYELVYKCYEETKLGREDIGTFVFRAKE